MRVRDFIPDYNRGRVGKYNAITDVDGVLVGQTQFIRDSPHVQRTGATVIMPHSRDIFSEAVYASSYVLNGYGILTGISSVNELGILSSPVVLTNTRSIGNGYEAVMQYFLERGVKDADLPLPVVGECDDSYLNDSSGEPVPIELFKEAFRSSRSGKVDEGGVGAGTGMSMFGFKGGIGTSSRIVEIEGTSHTVGVLINANFGRRYQLSILGKRFGPENRTDRVSEGSCIGVLATDAPVPPNLLKRIARRMSLGLSRSGSVGNNTSGEIFLAFSTADTIYMDPDSSASGRLKEHAQGKSELNYLSNDVINGLFDATVDATEEAALNALFQAKTTRGYGGHVMEGFDPDKFLDLQS